MNNNITEQESAPSLKPKWRRRGKNNRLMPASIFLSSLVIAGAWVYTTLLETRKNQSSDAVSAVQTAQTIDPKLQEAVLPADGAVLPVNWGDLGARLAQEGVIDKQKLEELYASRGGMTVEEKQLLAGAGNGNLKITLDNSGFLLNLFWALGLANKNAILDKGPISDPRYGNPADFASTGGWTLASGDAMNHFSKHQFVALTEEQQKAVEEVSQNIYRPCCNNATYFPDCNHGMAMLGLLELMASQGINKDEMYKVALQVNSYWFPDTYLTIGQFLKERGVEWSQATPVEILGPNFSSASGYQQVTSQVSKPVQSSGSGCGV